MAMKTDILATLFGIKMEDFMECFYAELAFKYALMYAQGYDDGACDFEGNVDSYPSTTGLGFLERMAFENGYRDGFSGEPYDDNIYVYSTH